MPISCKTKCGRTAILDEKRLKRYENKMQYGILEWLLDSKQNYKDIVGKIWENLNMDCIFNIIKLILTFEGVRMVLWLCRGILLEATNLNIPGLIVMMSATYFQLVSMKNKQM